jgi:hypothetical protein
MHKCAARRNVGLAHAKGYRDGRDGAVFRP